MGGWHPQDEHARLHAHSRSEAVERAVTELAHHGERVTAPRRAVLEVLAASHEHRTAEEIVQALEDARPPVHRATVYRTLDRLTELGIATRSHSTAEASGYHLAVTSAGHEHLHARCHSCGRIVVLDSAPFDPAIGQVAEGSAFLLQLERSDLVGLCEDCSQNTVP